MTVKLTLLFTRESRDKQLIFSINEELPTRAVIDLET